MNSAVTSKNEIWPSLILLILYKANQTHLIRLQDIYQPRTHNQI